MKHSKAPQDAAGAVAAQQGVLGQNALDAPLAQLRRTAETFKNASAEQLAGRLKEDLHAATGSASAARHGLSDITFRTGDALGVPTDPADIFVMKGSRVVDRAQSKCCGSIASTTGDIAQNKYDGMQRVVPKDQVDSVGKLAEKRGVDGLGKRNYPETAKTVSGRVRHSPAESRPVSREQALDAAKDPEAAIRRARRAEGIRTVRNTALATGVVSCGISTYRNAREVRVGDKEIGEALVAIGIDTATGLASGAATGAATLAVRGALGRVGARTLARGSVPVATALFLVDVGKDGIATLNGDIDGAEFGKRAAGHAVKGATTWAGMKAGATLGTAILPGGGTILGGLVGAICGGLFGERLTASEAPNEQPEPTQSDSETSYRIVDIEDLSPDSQSAVKEASHLHRYTVSGDTVITWLRTDECILVLDYSSQDVEEVPENLAMDPA